MEWIPHRSGPEDGLCAWRWMTTVYGNDYRVGIDRDAQARGGPWQVIHSWGFATLQPTHVVQSRHAHLIEAVDVANALMQERRSQGYQERGVGPFIAEEVAVPDPGQHLYARDGRRWREVGTMPGRISMDSDGTSVWITALAITRGGALVVVQNHADAEHPQGAEPDYVTLDVDEAVEAANALLGAIPADPARPIHQTDPFTREEVFAAAQIWDVDDTYGPAEPLATMLF